jgi:hypothetical protein
VKLSIHLAASAAGLALLAAALPAAAFAKGPGALAASTSQLTVKAPGVSAQDTGADKPKVEGWQTGAGEISDQSCQNFADRIDEELDAAGEDADNGDYEGMNHHFENADAWESMATDFGCAIKYPA